MPKPSLYNIHTHVLHFVYTYIRLGIWLVARGIEGKISHYFHVGVSIILLTGLLRYIDLVGNYMGAAILFAVFAAILLFAARYWRAALQGEAS